MGINSDLRAVLRSKCQAFTKEASHTSIGGQAMNDTIGLIIEPPPFNMPICWLLFDSKVKGTDKPRILGSYTDIAMATSDIRAKLFSRRVALRPLRGIAVLNHEGSRRCDKTQDLGQVLGSTLTYHHSIAIKRPQGYPTAKSGSPEADIIVRFRSLRRSLR